MKQTINIYKNEKVSYLPLSILLLFLMLWLPLGQYDFLIDHWMKIGTYAIPFLLIGAFSFFSNSIENKMKLFAFAMLVIYLIHQFEEHWTDLFGEHYAFYTATNKFVLSLLNAKDSRIKPLTKESIFVINTSLVWLVGCIAIWKSNKYLFPLLAMTGVIFVNGITHIVIGIVMAGYNPGLLTTLVLFFPFALWFYRYVLKINSKFKKYIIAGIIWSVIAHVIMICGVLCANWYKLFPEFVYFILLVTWSFTPLFIFRNVTYAKADD